MGFVRGVHGLGLQDSRALCVCVRVCVCVWVGGWVGGWVGVGGRVVCHYQAPLTALKDQQQTSKTFYNATELDWHLYVYRLMSYLPAARLLVKWSRDLRLGAWAVCAWGSGFRISSSLELYRAQNPATESLPWNIRAACYVGAC